MRAPYIRIQLVYPWLARRDGCDVFHVNYYGPWFGAPGLVVTIQDLIYLDFPAFAPAARRAQMRVLGRLSVRAARLITTASAYSKRRIIERFGVAQEKISVVPNGLSRAWTDPDRGAIATAWARLAPAEGFGLPLLEAMAMGTPVVASNRTAIPEICGDAAALVDPADEEAVVQSARAVLTDAARRAELVDRGRGRVGLYGGERAAQLMLEVYRRARV